MLLFFINGLVSFSVTIGLLCCLSLINQGCNDNDAVLLWQRPAANYDTSQINFVESVNFGPHLGELFENQAYPCGRPDVHGDSSTLGFHEFGIIRPLGYDPMDPPQATVVYMKLTGGALGWLDSDANYVGTEAIATRSWNRLRMTQIAQETGSTLFASMRALHPEWTFLVPSMCSHDAYNGMGHNDDFPRYGWLALVAAIRYLQETGGILYLFAEGTSSGGTGVFYLARDLREALPQVQVRGVVMDSQSHEPTALAALMDTYSLLTLPDPINGGSVDVACDQNWEPAAPAFQRARTLRSASADISAGLVDAPIFHLWNRRDQQFCQHEAYSDLFIHGPIAAAIVNQNPVMRSMNRRVCVSNPVLELPCSKHGVLDGETDEDPGLKDPDITASIISWIESLHTNWDTFSTTPTLY